MGTEMFYGRRAHAFGSPYGYDPHNAGRSLAALKADGMAKVRKLEAQKRELERKIQGRLGRTFAHQAERRWVPRLERLTKALALDSFEVDVIVAIVGSEVLPMRSYLGGRKQINPTNGRVKQGCSVQALLSSFCCSLRDELSKRKHFYRSATLLKEGILHFVNDMQLLGGDLTNMHVEMDRRLLDYVCGLDTEFSELVNGSHLFLPKVALDDVVLPADIKSMVIDTARNFEAVRHARAELGGGELARPDRERRDGAEARVHVAHRGHPHVYRLRGDVEQLDGDDGRDLGEGRHEQ